MFKTVSLLWAMISISLPGCVHSSSYTPKASPQARFIVQNNRMMLYKEGLGAGLFDAAPRLACSHQAKATAESASGSLKAGAIMSALSGLGILLGAIPGVILAFLGLQRTGSGHAEMIDAVNMHNDAPSCRRAP